MTDFLSFPCKRTDRLDIKAPITKYITKVYGKEQVAEILQDVEEVARRRAEVVAVSGGGPSEGAKEIFASYYRALSVMETRFPISRDGGHVQLAFYWMNALNTRKKSKQLNIHFEKASVLFNVAAHMSQQGAQQNKDSQSGYKEAVQYFQESAAAFAKVRDVALKVENPKPSDLTADFLMMTEKLMLAQGQECVFWKAKKDDNSASLLSRLAKQTSVLYAEALSFLGKVHVREDLDRSWQDLVQSKSWAFEAFCQFHAAEDAKSKEDISTEISRLNQALMLLQRLQKSGKFMTNEMPSVIGELVSSASTRLHRAERDNASVYLKRVLPFNELPLISGAQLVKLGDCSYLDASKEHIFSELIPETITKALSRYSELVDNIIRREVNKLGEATDDARLKLKQYELPEILDGVTTTNPSLLPEALKTDLTGVEQCGGLAALEDIQTNLNGLKDTVKAELAAMVTELDEEAAQDSQLREQYGQQWTSSTSASQTAGLRKHIASYLDNLETSDKSDRLVQTKLANNLEQFRGLSVAACVERLPKLEAGMVNPSEFEPQTLVANLRSCLDQLSAMSEERAGLEESLKDMKEKDNLLPKLAATGVGSHEDLFNEELQKYEPLSADADENIRKQKEVLDYLRETFSSFQQTYNIPDWRTKIDHFCADVKQDIAAFYDVRTNLGEGMRFYMDLKSHVDELKQQSADYIMSRKIDREDRLELLKAKEKPPVAAAGQAPPPLPTDPPPYTPPSLTSVDSGQSSFAAAPPMPPAPAFQATALTAASVGSGTESTQMGHASAPPPPAPPAVGAQSQQSAHSMTQQQQQPVYDPMVESPNPYHSPPPSHQPSPPPQPYYDPQRPYQPSYQPNYQPNYQPGYQSAAPPPPPQNTPMPPPQPSYGHHQGPPPGHQPVQYAQTGQQYHQGAYCPPGQQQQQHPYAYQQQGQNPTYPYQQQQQPPPNPYPYPQGNQPPSHPSYPPPDYSRYQQQ